MNDLSRTDSEVLDNPTTDKERRMAVRPRLGHVHLEVRDVERSCDFYRGLLGVEITDQTGPFRFLTNSEAHHDLALQQSPRPGLYHVAFEVGSDTELRSVVDWLTERSIPFQAVDHGISHALYFADPDGLGVEVFLDRREAEGGSRSWDGHSRRLSL